MLVKIGDVWVDPAEITAVAPKGIAPEEADGIELILRQGGSLFAACGIEDAEEALIAAGLIAGRGPRAAAEGRRKAQREPEVRR